MSEPACEPGCGAAAASPSSPAAGPARQLGPTEVLLLRHPQPEVAAGLCYGQLDVPARQPLHPAPAEVLAALRASLGGRVPVQVLSSPLQRARALAEPLAQAFGLGLQVDARWQELAFGHWEGRRWADIPRHESDPWADDVHHRAPPGGESRAQLLARVAAALGALSEQPGVHVVVSHAGAIRCALTLALGLPPERVPEVALDFGRITALRWHPGAWARWEVGCVNR